MWISEFVEIFLIARFLPLKPSILVKPKDIFCTSYVLMFHIWKIVREKKYYQSSNTQNKTNCVNSLENSSKQRLGRTYVGQLRLLAIDCHHFCESPQGDLLVRGKSWSVLSHLLRLILSSALILVSHRHTKHQKQPRMCEKL